jgi:hypothetical protein
MREHDVDTVRASADTLKRRWDDAVALAPACGAPISSVARSLSRRAAWALTRYSRYDGRRRLQRHAGNPLLEKGMRKSRPGYAYYLERTSGFLPLPPHKNVTPP